MSKVNERVTFFEERGTPGSDEHFRRVEIKYSDGEIFFSGWIQDFGNVDSINTGPTVFSSNYVKHRLDQDTANKKKEYWDERAFAEEAVTIRDSTIPDLDELIDLNFQNYFEGGNNRISAYQGLNFIIDGEHTIICLQIERTIYGFLFIEWRVDHAGTRTAYFDSLYCAPAVRGHDFGSRLIDAGIKRAKERSCIRIDGLVMGTLDHCRRIKDLLEKNNFSIDRFTPAPVSALLGVQWYDLYMSLDLSSAADSEEESGN